MSATSRCTATPQQSSRRRVSGFTRSLESDRAPVLAVVGGCAIAVLEAVDELRAAEAELRTVGRDEALAAARELLAHLGGDLLLEAHGHVVVHDPARAVAAGLRILVVVREANHHLDM